MSHSQNINASVLLDSSDFRIGDPIVLMINVDHPYGMSVEWAQNTILPANFEVISESPVDTIQQKSFLTEKKAITITTFDTGRISIPEMKIWYRDQNGTLNSIRTNQVPVYISLAAVNLKEPFRSISPPLLLPATDNLKYLMGGGIVLLIILFFIYWKRRQKTAKQYRPQKKILPPESVISRLHRLEQDVSHQKIPTEYFYMQLSLLLREYIGQRFSVAAFEHTSSEIIRLIRKHLDDEALLEKIAVTFELADLVKFARVLPANEENNKMVKSVIEFVKKTDKTLQPSVNAI